MKIMKKTATALLSAIVLAGCAAAPTQEEGNSIVVGSKDFTEQHILGHMLTHLLQYNTDLDVSFVPGMSTNILFAAIQSGDVDLYIEYTGTVYISLLGYEEILPAQETFDIAASGLEEFGILMLQPLGFNNTYALAVRPDTAAEYNLQTISDLVQVSENFHFGGSFEFLARPDGIVGLRERYGMAFASETGLEGVLTYTALENDEIQVTAAFATDGMLMAFELAVLEDDLEFFPPYHAAPVIRRDIAEQHPEVPELLSQLEGILDDNTMRGLNYRVDVMHESPQDVARDFLISVGLIS